MPRKASNDRVLSSNHEATQAARALDGKLTEFRIEGVPGLVLRVSPSGGGAWWFYYRHRLGKRWTLRKIALGDRKSVKLVDVRRAAFELKNKTEGGSDPVADGLKRRDAITFQELAERRLEKDTRLAASTRRHYRELLERKVFKKIGSTPASEVTTEMVVGVLNKINADRQADLVKAAISSTFRWGMKRHEVKSNPCTGLGLRAAVGVRTRVLTDAELEKLWRTTERDDIWFSDAMRRIIHLCLLTGQRRTQVAGVRKAELSNLDGVNATWTIPGNSLVRGKVIEGRTKNKKEQVLPLSPQAAQLFREAYDASADPECLFPARLTSVKIGKTPRTPHIHGQSVGRAMGLLRSEAGIADVTVHDLRRTMATWMGNQGVRPDVIDLALHHLPKAQDVTRRHYNHSRLEPMVRAALQQWADHVWQLTGQGAGNGNVVKLRA